MKPSARTCGPARLRRGDDLATVSKALKIRKDHLEALEEDRLEALPGRTYAVGFARTYADYLGLDTARVVERYKTQIAGRTDDQTPTITVIDEDEHRRLPQGWKIIAGVVFLLLAYGAYHLIVPAADKMLAPPCLAGTCATWHRSPRRKRTAASMPQRLRQPPQPGHAGRNGAPMDRLPQRRLAPQRHRNSKPRSRRGRCMANNTRTPAWCCGCRQTTRVLVQDPNGTVYLNRTLNAGDSYMVPNVTGLTLSTADAGAVEIDLDGVAMGNAGRSGQIGESLSLDPASHRRPQQQTAGIEHEHQSLSRYSPPQIPPDHGRQGAGRRRRADHRADDDQHDHRRRARDHRPDPRASRKPAPTSCACPAPTRTRPRR